MHLNEFWEQVSSWLLGAARAFWTATDVYVDERLVPIAVFAAGTIVMLVVARLIALLVGPNSRWPYSQRTWSVVIWIAFGFIFIVAWIWTYLASRQPPKSGAWDQWWAIFAAVGGLLSTVIFGLGLGHRLRIRMEVVGPGGKKSPVNSAYVAARMTVMGSGKPAGLWFPHGSDASNLPENASSSSGNEGLIAALIRALRGLFSWDPWKLQVVLADSQTMALTLSRNLHRKDVELVSPSDLGLEYAATGKDGRANRESERALLTGAASFALLELSDCYPSLREGLGGVTNWRSFAMQVLAGTPPWKSNPAVTRELFAQAVDLDPKNLPAWLGYFFTQNGAFGSQESLTLLIESLQELWDRVEKLSPEAELALRLRLLRTTVLAQLNLRLLGGKKEVTDNVLDVAQVLMKEIEWAEMDGKKAVNGQPRLREFVDRMRPLAASLYLYVLKLPDQEGLEKLDPERDRLTVYADRCVGKDITVPSITQGAAVAENNRSAADSAEERLPVTPFSLVYHYEKACQLVEEASVLKGKSEANEEYAKKAVRLSRDALKELRLALGMRSRRNTAFFDPSLKPLRNDPEFVSLTDAAGQISSLDALKSHAEHLNRDGIRMVTDFVLWNKESGDQHLATSLEVPVETVRWMRGICELELSCPIRSMGIGWTNLLTGEGINDVVALNNFADPEKRESVENKEIFARLTRKAAETSLEIPTWEDLGEWARKSLQHSWTSTNIRQQSLRGGAWKRAGQAQLAKENISKVTKGG